MREKDIKRQVLKQLKKEFPRWRRLPRKENKRIAKEVLESVLAKHSSNEQATDIPVHELDFCGEPHLHPASMLFESGDRILPPSTGWLTPSPSPSIKGGDVTED